MKRRTFRLRARGTVARDVAEELAFHLEEAARGWERRGHSAQEAKELAMRDFGVVEGAAEELISIDRRAHRREVRRDWWGGLRRDLAYAFRMLRKNPAFTAMAVGTLALGIGATTAIFAVVDATLLAPLPYPESDRIAVIGPAGEDPRAGVYTTSYGVVQQYEELATEFDELGAYTITLLEVRGGREPRRASALAVTSSLLPVLRVEPLLGRGFTRAGDERGAPREIMLSHSFWRSAFDGAQDVVGRVILVDGEPYEVVGVLPAQLQFPLPFRMTARWFAIEPDVWVPAGTLADLHQRGGFFVYGRLRAGASFDAAGEQLRGALRAAVGQGPLRETAERTRVEQWHAQVVAPLRPAVLAFFGAVACVLLIACINLGGLLLARLSVRGRELAVRAALGAGRGAIVRQLLVEALMLSLVGGALGLLLAAGALELLLRLAPLDVPQIHAATLDGRALLFTLVISVGCGVLFGVLPALRGAQSNLQSAVAAGGRGGMTERSTRRLHGVLIVTEIAFAVTLLVGAGLLLRTFRALSGVDPGFRSEQVVTMDVQLAGERYDERGERLLFFDRLERSLHALPGVTAVGGTDRLPFAGSISRTDFTVVGAEPLDAPSTLNLVARPSYFVAMEIPLVRGRLFDERDNMTAPDVIVVSRAFADRYLPGTDAIGQRVDVFGAEREIVGVVGDVRQVGPASGPEPMMYFPHAQDVRARMTMVVRTERDADALAAALRAAVNALDADLPIGRIRSFASLREEQVAGQQFNAGVVSAFGLLALLLAAVGVYGVMSFAVATRTREIGVRMALGATGQSVRRVLLRQALLVSASGTVLGLGAAIALSRGIVSLLYDVAPTDITTYASVALLLLATALAAAWLPVRRATRVHPMEALRYE